MTAVFRERVVAGALLCVTLATLAVHAAPVRKIQFSDTKLKNGLRVIISEDHAAPVFSSSSITTSAPAMSGEAAQGLPTSSNT